MSALVGIVGQRSVQVFRFSDPFNELKD